MGEAKFQVHKFFSNDPQLTERVHRVTEKISKNEKEIPDSSKSVQKREKGLTPNKLDQRISGEEKELGLALKTSNQTGSDKDEREKLAQEILVQKSENLAQKVQKGAVTQKGPNFGNRPKMVHDVLGVPWN